MGTYRVGAGVRETGDGTRTGTRVGGGGDRDATLEGSPDRWAQLQEDCVLAVCLCPCLVGVPCIKILHPHAKQEEPVFCPRGAEVKRETSQNRRISINTNKCGDCH